MKRKDLKKHTSAFNLPMGTNGVSLNFFNSFEVWLVSDSYSEKTESWPDDMVAVKAESLSSAFRNTKLRQLLDKESIFHIPPVTPTW